MAQGMTASEAIRQLGLSEETYYRWLSEYGAMQEGTFLLYCKKIKRIVNTQFCKMLFGSFGKGSQVLGSLVLYQPRLIYVGENCIINEGVMLNGHGVITIGDHVRISPRASIISTGLEFDACVPPYKHYAKAVEIGEGVWIATGAIVLPGSRIGQNSVVAAGAVVCGNVEPNVVVGGVPAKTIRKIRKTNAGRNTVPPTKKNNIGVP